MPTTLEIKFECESPGCRLTIPVPVYAADEATVGEVFKQAESYLKKDHQWYSIEGHKLKSLFCNSCGRKAIDMLFKDEKGTLKNDEAQIE